ANVTYWDATLPAFGIRVGMTRKTWLLMVGKKRRRKSIGHYPDLSLSKARAEAKKLLAHRVEYLDITFAEAMEQFLAVQKQRTRILSDAELQLIWQGSDSEELPSPFRAIVKLCILTGQRRGEIGKLKGIYFSHNQQTLCLPGEITKNGREHTFPVGTLCASV